MSLSLDPWTEGPYTTGHRLYTGVSNNGLDHQLDVWLPNAAGTFPVIYFLSGLAATVPGIAYTQVMERISSHGYIVLGPWALVSNPVTNYQAEWLVEVQAWVEANLEERLHTDGFHPELALDNEDVFLMGNSAGCHIIVEYMKHHCNKVKGQILLSPVDGFDPFGLIDLYAITPGQYLNYDVPTLVIMAGLDNTTGSHVFGDLTPACAPDKISNMRFYNAMPGPTWMVNATLYGHGDILDEFFYDVMEVIHFCGTDPSLDRVPYRTFVAGEVISFLAVILHGDCEALKYIEDSEEMPVGTVAFKKSSVIEGDWKCGMEPYCIWQDHPFPGM